MLTGSIANPTCLPGPDPRLPGGPCPGSLQQQFLFLMADTGEPGLVGGVGTHCLTDKINSSSDKGTKADACLEATWVLSPGDSKVTPFL